MITSIIERSLIVKANNMIRLVTTFTDGLTSDIIKDYSTIQQLQAHLKSEFNLKLLLRGSRDGFGA
jgi:hypothetical protein